MYGRGIRIIKAVRQGRIWPRVRSCGAKFGRGLGYPQEEIHTLFELLYPMILRFDGAETPGGL